MNLDSLRELAAKPKPRTITVDLPLEAGSTYPEIQVSCRPTAGRMQISIIRYRGSSIDRVLATGETRGDGWQDVRIVAPLALALPTDVVRVVIAGEGDIGTIEIEPPPVDDEPREPRLWSVKDEALQWRSLIPAGAVEIVDAATVGERRRWWCRDHDEADALIASVLALGDLHLRPTPGDEYGCAIVATAANI